MRTEQQRKLNTNKTIVGAVAELATKGVQEDQDSWLTCGHFQIPAHLFIFLYLLLRFSLSATILL